MSHKATAEQPPDASVETITLESSDEEGMEVATEEPSDRAPELPEPQPTEPVDHAMNTDGATEEPSERGSDFSEPQPTEPAEIADPMEVSDEEPSERAPDFSEPRPMEPVAIIPSDWLRSVSPGPSAHSSEADEEEEARLLAEDEEPPLVIDEGPTADGQSTTEEPTADGHPITEELTPVACTPPADQTVGEDPAPPHQPASDPE